ncbi:TetR family transcriptional regulator [Roseomonas sp. CCTCC AB2023176]|uniref:TetR family transcriptional regulator n=1 Tax=Roseomonas sp. CCTCC AB2023176 TaxID=3342640 RepID=UPI0035DDBB4E
MQDPTAAADPSPTLLDALWAVVARHGWHGTTFARVAAESGESLSELRARYATPVDLLRAHARAVDRFVLDGTVPDPDGTTPVRDRLFDLLMRRFDALAPHREGILRLQRDLMRDPISALALSPILLASMAWTLEGAGVPTGGPAGVLRVHGLAGVWLDVSRTWAGDDSVDLGSTMAALDRALDRADKVARTLRLDAGEVPAVPSGATSVADAPLMDDASPVPDNPPDALGPESPGEGPETAIRPPA